MKGAITIALACMVIMVLWLLVVIDIDRHIKHAVEAANQEAGR